MTDEELRSYRLTSTEEPSDEMLQAIMDKVGEAARASSARAEARKQEMLRNALELARAKQLTI